MKLIYITCCNRAWCLTGVCRCDLGPLCVCLASSGPQHLISHLKINLPVSLSLSSFHSMNMYEGPALRQALERGGCWGHRDGIHSEPWMGLSKAVICLPCCSLHHRDGGDSGSGLEN